MDTKSNSYINNIGMFDMNRGILMIIIVCTHSLSLVVDIWTIDIVHAWTAIFAPLKVLVYGVIPLFFMMSGYQVGKRSIKRNIRTQVNYLIKPYYIWAIIIVIVNMIIAVFEKKDIFKELVYYAFPFLFGICPGNSTIFGTFEIKDIGPLWFIVALAGTSILFNIILHIQNEMMQMLICFSLAIVAASQPFKNIIPFCIFQIMACLFYFWVGYYVRKTKLLMIKAPWYEIIFYLAIIIYVVPRGFVEVSQNVYTLGAVDYIGSVVAGLALFRLSMLFQVRTGRIYSLLSKIGVESFNILKVHTFEYLVFPWKKVIEILPTNAIISILVVIIARVLIIVIGIWAIHKFYYLRKKVR